VFDTAFWQIAQRLDYASFMGKHGKDEWLRDIDRRQRNVVFPDTVQNEGRLWRNAWSGQQSLNFAQWAGVLVMFLFFGAGLVYVLVMLWPQGQASWWQKVISAYGLYILVIGAGVTIITLGNLRARRKAHRR